ncbi:unnamed protein product [Protopolystoma xenopodis]|uniref:Meiosis-specific nuclear structural protein 1 n=1 Tax=Protopolystoma xenopodis TaxID=117903 RepID=A0A448WAF4_9PLAT|nr:unnamed protein product [Protopolystoma xenopodis]
MLEKFAKDDRLEQMSAQRRRQKQLEHQREVQTLIEARRTALAVERASQAERLAEEQQIAEERRRIIEEERQLILQQHAEQLFGYLPKGVIKNENDLEFMGPAYKAEYCPKSRNLVDLVEKSLVSTQQAAKNDRNSVSSSSSNNMRK